VDVKYLKSCGVMKMNWRLGLARADSMRRVMLTCLLTASMNTSNSSIARKGHSMASHRANNNATVEKERSPPERLLVFLISCCCEALSVWI